MTRAERPLWNAPPLLVSADLVPCPGQGLGGGIDRGRPTAAGLYPHSVMAAAHVSLIDKLITVLEPAHHCKVQGGGLHLMETGGDNAEYRHYLGDILVTGKAQNHRVGINGVVPASGEVIRQRPILPTALVGKISL